MRKKSAGSPINWFFCLPVTHRPVPQVLHQAVQVGGLPGGGDQGGVVVFVAAAGEARRSRGSGGWGRGIWGRKINNDLVAIKVYNRLQISRPRSNKQTKVSKAHSFKKVSIPFHSRHFCIHASPNSVDGIRCISSIRGTKTFLLDASMQTVEEPKLCPKSCIKNFRKCIICSSQKWVEMAEEFAISPFHRQWKA